MVLKRPQYIPRHTERFPAVIQNRDPRYVPPAKPPAPTPTGKLCSECGNEIVTVASLRIDEEGERREFCSVACGLLAVQHVRERESHP